MRIDEENMGIERLSSGQGRGEEIERRREEAYPKLRMMKKQHGNLLLVIFCKQCGGR